MILDTIAQVTNGYSFRSRIEADPEAQGFVLQAADVREEGICLADLTPYNTADFSLERLLQEGDVVFADKLSFKAAVFRSPEKESASVLPSSSVVVIRLMHRRVLPEYLALVLNSSSMQRYFQSVSIGHTHRTIRIDEIRSIEIPEIPQVKQQELIALAQSIQTQKAYNDQKNLYLDQLLDGTIQQIIQ